MDPARRRTARTIAEGSPMARLRWAMGCAALAAAGLLGRAAEAQPQQCPPSQTTWAREAAQAIDTPLRIELCAPVIKVRLEPAGAPPMSVEIARGEGPAFRRVGDLRVSPILEVDDFTKVPAPQREGFERLVRWLSVNHDKVPPPAVEALAAPRPAVAPRGPSQSPSPPHVPWVALLGAAAALAAAASELRRRRPALADAAAAALVWGAALACRLLLGAWGPFHVNGHGAGWVMALVERRVDPMYGPGFHELWSWLLRLGLGEVDTRLFAANALLASLVAPLAFAAARLAGLEARRALLVGAVLAVDPVSIRFAATESYYPSIQVFLLLSAVCLELSVRREPGPGTSALWALAGGWMAAQAARVHPCGWFAIAVLPVVAWVAASGPVRSRTTRTLAVVACAAGAAGLVSGGTLLTAFHTARQSQVLVIAAPVRQIAVALVLLAAGCAVAWRWGRPRRFVLWLGVPAAAALATRHIMGSSPLWEGAYDRSFLVWPLAAAAAWIPTPWLAARRAWFAAAGVSASVLVVGWGTVRDRTTDHTEYGFVRGWAATMPATCRAMYVGMAEHRAVELPEYAAAKAVGPPFLRIDGKMPPATVEYERGECLFYIRTSLCSSREGRPICGGHERRYDLREVARAALPANPGRVSDPYDTDPVEVVVYRVEGLRP